MTHSARSVGLITLKAGDSPVLPVYPGTPG
jgi:hypothetical protein